MVVDRSATAEAMFVYAVRTTGVYCRPSCPSRRPLRKSVEFYPT
ncbi:MAG: Ada metal-binding domain-containing protein, partial [Acidobacteriaceae bacterium]